MCGVPASVTCTVLTNLHICVTLSLFRLLAVHLFSLSSTFISLVTDNWFFYFNMFYHVSRISSILLRESVTNLLISYYAGFLQVSHHLIIKETTTTILLLLLGLLLSSPITHSFTVFCFTNLPMVDSLPAQDCLHGLLFRPPFVQLGFCHTML